MVFKKNSILKQHKTLKTKSKQEIVQTEITLDPITEEVPKNRDKKNK